MVCCICVCSMLILAVLVLVWQSILMLMKVWSIVDHFGTAVAAYKVGIADAMW